MSSVPIAPIDSSEARKASAVRDILNHGESENVTFYLSDSATEGAVELPRQIAGLLKAVADAMSRGRVVSIHSLDQEVSTQQAADLLGLSRPTVVKLIDDGVLAARVPGVAKRRLPLSEVLAYRDRLYEQRSEFIAASSAEYADYEAADFTIELHEMRRERQREAGDS